MREKSSEPGHSRVALFLAWFQGIYFVVAGFWPIPGIDSFMMITGPKTDIWLVRTVGLLLVAVGGVLCLAAYRKRISLEVAVLAVASALALTGIEVVYTANGTISRIYLLDAVVEGCLILGWLAAWVPRRGKATALR